MANYTKALGSKINGKNGKQEIEINTSMPISAYESIKDVLVAGKIAPVSALERKGVPIDEQVRGTGTAASYKKGLIYCERENQGTACIEALVPKDEDAQKTLKSTLASKTIGGEKPTNVRIQLWG